MGHRLRMVAHLDYRGLCILMCQMLEKCNFKHISNYFSVANRIAVAVCLTVNLVAKFSMISIKYLLALIIFIDISSQ
jgi:hypothetical protein